MSEEKRQFSGDEFLKQQTAVQVATRFWLESLEIRNFRCFEHLVIDKLGRVNLIVGKNGMGKTTLLEGLWLLASGASWSVLHSILFKRNELVRFNQIAKKARQEQIEAIKSLFFTHPPTKAKSALFRIGGKNASELKPRFPEYLVDGREVLRDNATHSDKPIIEFELKPDDIILVKGYPKPGYLTELGWPDLPSENDLIEDVIAKSMHDAVVFIPVQGLPLKAQARYWDITVLHRKNKSVLDCLHIVEPDIYEYAFRGDNLQDYIRFPSVSTKRFLDGVPLAKLGEGIQRILALALAMSASSKGYLLIDEFEAGLHHSVQTDVWRAVVKLAHEWNVQVFATTHSEDCVKSFQEASAENESEDAMLIRLQAKRDSSGIVATTYDKESMAVVTRQGIEIR